MKSRGGLGLALLAGLLVLVISCSSLHTEVVAPLEIPGANYVGNQACYDCHTNISRMFPSSAHARIHLEGTSRAGQTGCESCHGAASLHIAAGGGRGKFILNPGNTPDACFRCHMETHAQFNLPQHHPVVEGRMNCVQCHDPHGSDIFKPAGGLARARLNESCAQCHREQTRPVVFEHEAMREGCTTCHSPHGSINRKLLVDADANLCLRCHSQQQANVGGVTTFLIGGVPHDTFVNRSSCWAASCHTAVHGSNVDPRLRY